MLPIRNISYLLPMCCSFWEKCKNSPKTSLGCSTPLMYSSCLKCLSFIGLLLVLISYTSHYINVLCSITLNISSKVVATYTYKVRNDRPHNQHSLLNGIKLVIFTEINDIVCFSLAYISLFNQLWLWSYTYMYSIILFSYNIRSSTFSKM